MAHKLQGYTKKLKNNNEITKGLKNYKVMTAGNTNYEVITKDFRITR